MYIFSKTIKLLYSHDKNHNGVHPPEKNLQKNKVSQPQMHLAKVTILQFSRCSKAEKFATFASSGAKYFCKISLAQFAKMSLFNANFAIFAYAQIAKSLKCSLALTISKPLPTLACARS